MLIMGQRLTYKSLVAKNLKLLNLVLSDRLFIIQILDSILVIKSTLVNLTLALFGIMCFLLPNKSEGFSEGYRIAQRWGFGIKLDDFLMLESPKYFCSNNDLESKQLWPRAEEIRKQHGLTEIFGVGKSSHVVEIKLCQGGQTSLYFCASNGERAIYWTHNKIDKEESNPNYISLFDQSSQNFIGRFPSEETYFFNFRDGRQASYSGYSKEYGTRRVASYDIWFGEGTVTQTIARTGLNSSKVDFEEICPNTNERIKYEMPQFRGLKEVLVNGALGMGSYEQRFARLKHCKEKLPDKSSDFDKLAIKHEEFNSQNFNAVKSKISEILMNVSSPNVRDTFYNLYNAVKNRRPEDTSNWICNYYLELTEFEMEDLAPKNIDVILDY